MATDAERDLSLICETLRDVGVAEDKIEAFAKLWQQKLAGPAAESADTIAASSGEAGTEGGVRFPNVRVRLRDLDDKLGPILRRVSYAMRDAGVDEAEIDKYKEAVRAARSPAAASRRWVRVD